MPLFELRNNSKDRDLEIAKKAKSKSTKKNTAVIKNGGILSLVKQAQMEVEKHLRKYKDEYILLTDLKEIEEYVDKCVKHGIASLDTETTGKNPMKDILVGISLYTPGEKACYIPINHISYSTFERLPNQPTEKELAPIIQKLTNCKLVMYNAVFDIRMIRNQMGVYLKCWFDCSLASRMLNENEIAGKRKLKLLHQKYVLKGKEDVLTFSGITDDPKIFQMLPLDIAKLYGAHDAKITFEYYEFQEPFLSLDQEREDLRGVANAFWNNEMPLLDIVADMENTGVNFDKEYNAKLQIEYHKSMQEAADALKQEIKKYTEEDININSPEQLSHLIYDILKLKSIDTRKPRSTDKKILKAMKNDLCNKILDYRSYTKMVSTYIDKLPNCIDPNTGRIHCLYNQYGADTGRFSSSDPNLQNIPSHNKDIRKMFIATEGYILMSSDYSQQEPKVLAAFCRMMGDNSLYDAVMAGRDLYSEVAAKAFHQTYEECMEHFPKGTPIKCINNKWYYATKEDYDKLADGVTDTYDDGEERRNIAKTILLGVLYGRSEESIADELKCSLEEAKDIKASVFKGFLAIKEFEANSIKMSKELGYVTTIAGRKRRLPIMQLPRFEFRRRVFNPDAKEGESKYSLIDDLDDKTITYWYNRLKGTFGKKKADLMHEASNKGVYVIDHNKDINETTRQVVNARIQGSAADLSKAAMIEIHNNPRVKEIGLRILIPIHDEFIVECPVEHAKEGKKLLAELMSKAAERMLQMPIGCDVTCSYEWYGEEVDVECL